MPRVLIVDDDDDHAEILARFFRTWGWSARKAFDSASALASAARKPPDLVTLDVVMAPEPGRIVFEALRAAGCVVPVALVTAADPGLIRGVPGEFGSLPVFGKDHVTDGLKIFAKQVASRSAG